MKKLPTLNGKQRKWPAWRSFGVVGLVVLLLAVSYLGTLDAKEASVTLPMERVPLDGIESVDGELETTPEPGATAAPGSTAVPGTSAAPTPSPVPAIAEAEAGFDAYKARLTATRAASAKLLDEVIMNASASAETVQTALQQKAELARSNEVEATIETILTARGYPDALVTVRQGSVQIVVKTTQLTQQQAAQILDIAVSETAEPAANIRIVPAK